ncbi:hypothetical protein ITJ86_04780 [Winogradskyella sp. F6397]|uniref:TNF family profile domain-containing protein n=1 Tax=Winogradskyella marina TaxID=2785530 RepID=A0ABS0EFG5_9FLAO|nr:hypothetical protein [Winogradskyella marina]MBF8149197.1 hypothetical protein [Winogradskyella marina]
MKVNLTLLGLFLIFTTLSFSQVGIGVEDPDASSILELKSSDKGLLLPRLTTAERDLISSPAEGLTIYNTTTESLEVYELSSTSWKRLSKEENGTPSLTMYKNLDGASGSITSSNGSANFTQFPLGTTEITEIDSEYFNVIGDGEIEILKTGSYLINGSFSVRNLRSGSNKYILAVFIGTQRIGYMARGFATSTSQDYFGVSGTFQYHFTAGDNVNIKYLIDNGSSNLNGDLLHIGINKL